MIDTRGIAAQQTALRKKGKKKSTGRSPEERAKILAESQAYLKGPDFQAPAGAPDMAAYQSYLGGVPGNASPVPYGQWTQTLGATQPISTVGNPQDYMAAFNSLLGTMAGPAPSYSFDASPYQQAIGQVQNQAALGQQTINQGGQDLMARLQALRAQTEQRGAEDRAAIQGTQQKALAGAQGALNPVLADLRAQGVDVRALEQGANQRIGVMQDQAAAQNLLSQRLQQNTGQVMDATGRSAATQGAGALNTLAMNLANSVNAIGQQQAKGAADTQAQYLQSLGQYNKARMGTGQDLLGIISKLGAGGQEDLGLDPVRQRWATEKGATADKVNEVFGFLDSGDFESVDDIIGDLDRKDVEDPDDKTKKIDTWELWRRQGVNVNTVKAALREATKRPKNSTVNPLAALGLG